MAPCRRCTELRGQATVIESHAALRVIPLLSCVLAEYYECISCDTWLERCRYDPDSRRNLCWAVLPDRQTA